MTLKMKHCRYYYCIFIIFAMEVSNTSRIEVDDLQMASTLTIQNWFPEDIKFNESCLTEGCPQLTNFNLCPDEVDANRMNSFLDIISSCMRGPLCGITLDKRPIAHLRMPIEDFVPGTSIKGFVTTIPGAGHLSNVSNIECEFLPGQTGRLPVQMTFYTPELRARGRLDIEITLPIEWLTTPGQRLDIHLPNATYDATYQFYSTIWLNRSSSDSPIEIEFLNPIIKARYEFCGMDIPDGLPNIVQLFTQVSNDLMEKSDFAKTKAKLLKKLFQSAINVVSKDCFNKILSV